MWSEITREHDVPRRGEHGKKGDEDGEVVGIVVFFHPLLLFFFSFRFLLRWLSLLHRFVGTK